MNDRQNAEQKREIIEADIELIDTALSSENESDLRETHRIIDGKYQACIRGWGMGMYVFHKEYGFLYDRLNKKSLKENLKSMRAKLEAYKEGWNNTSVTTSQDSSDITLFVNNSNTNINITLSFEQAKQKIEDMPGLTQENTEEIIRKINELENISKEDISKKKKWEKVKPILSFVLDKGADVATTFMGLILQMKLGA